MASAKQARKSDWGSSLVYTAAGKGKVDTGQQRASRAGQKR